jgi:hypothetical protein
MAYASGILAMLLGSLAAIGCGGDVLASDAGANGPTSDGAALSTLGSCGARQSVPSDMTRQESGGTTSPELLATLPYPSEMAVDETNAYVLSSVGTYKVPLDGGAPTLLDSVGATSLAIDATRVYTGTETATNPGAMGPPGVLVACAKCGCGGHFTTLASAQNSGIVGLAVDSGYVYWIDGSGEGRSNPGSVMKLAVDGGSPIPLVLATFANHIAVAQGFVFFATPDPSLQRIPASGGSPTTVQTAGSADFVSALAADDGNVYYQMTGGVVGQTPIHGGPPVMLFAGTQYKGGRQIAVDSQSSYFIDDQTILSVPIGGGAAKTIATGQPSPTGLAVDAIYVYWTNSADGTVMRSPK